MTLQLRCTSPSVYNNWPYGVDDENVEKVKAWAESHDLKYSHHGYCLKGTSKNSSRQVAANLTR
jgi:hypothetical protein